MRRFEREGLDTQILMPEEMGYAERLLAYIRPTMEDPETRDFPGFFCSHGWERGGLANWQTIADGMRPYGRRFWMTETGGAGADWQGAMAVAERMHRAIAGGNASAWLFYQFTYLYEEGVKKPDYFAAKHFYRFLRPGAVRIDSTCDNEQLLVSAYEHPGNGTLTGLFINKADETVTVRLAVSHGSAPEVYNVWISSESDGCNHKGTMSGGGEFELQMPPRSILTIEGATRPDAITALEPLGTPDPEAVPPPLFVKYGHEPLHLAARSDKLEDVERLIAEGADVNKKNIVDFTPLHRLAIPGHARIIAALVEAGAELDTRDVEGATPLYLASGWGQLESATAFLAAGADPNVPDLLDWTALHAAALGPNDAIVSALLAAGVEVNARADDGTTPLHAAVASPYSAAVKAVRQLVEAGADVTARTDDGWTPLHSAAANSHTSYRVDPDDAAEKIRILVAAGADVNAVDDSGRTPLHWAAWIGHFRLEKQDDASYELKFYDGAVKALMAAGADVNAKDGEGNTALHYAESEGYSEIAEALKAAGAD
jgi:ankyrin repeat protein